MVFYMKCLSMISLVQIFSHVTYFPPIFTAADVFWLIFIQTPILSFTILASPADPDLMTWASIKNSTKNSNLQLFPQHLLHFCTKFVPSSIVVVLVNTLCILSICTDLDEKLTRFTNESEVAEQNRTFLVQCRPLISVLVKNESKIPDVDFVGIVNQKYRQSQQLSVFILFLYMCIISSTYIQRWKLLKHQSPFRNKPWIMAVVVLLVAQTIYSAIVISINSLNQNEVVSTPTLFFGPYQWVIYLVASLWTIVCFASNEAAKWREISDWTRSQKRARLEFGTKLGMNSPF
uniref:Cation-transporting P-type ATPase C-terminal domain-containing protein n=1 Tax=Ciona savignyi TaxID=51511 RepID=H2YX59_CIOSA